MTIKGLVFSLFLYFGLVWTLAAYRHPGPEFREFGLFWTAAGLFAVLFFVIAARVFGWWRLWRARVHAKPSAPAKRPEPVHEDDAALAALIGEANTALGSAPAYAHKKTSLGSLPVYLLIGPEGTGKTSTFINAGLEPQLLAGQVAGGGPVVPTQLCNIWLVKNAIFVEFAGRAFRGDLGRWTQLLRVLRGNSHRPFWRRFWGEAERGVTIAGVAAFCEAKHFTATSNLEQSARYGRDWQERLSAIGEVFGADYPVYQLITKCDTIAFFEDYFRRLPEAEAQQILGCTLPLDRAETPQPGQVFAEVETKRLSRSFHPLFHALAARRITHLAYEPDPARRLGVYEFPREFKRIRPYLVQFLTNVYRPHPLRPGPVLRGYYLTAVRQVEAMAAAGASTTRQDWSMPGVASDDATRLFRGDATQFLRPDDLAPRNGGHSAFTTRWMFAADLFHNVILRDHRALPAPVRVDSQVERYRRMAVAGLGAVCALLCFVWIWSWVENRQLLRDIAAVSGTDFQSRPRGQGTVADLQALEALRVQVEKLTAHRHNGAPLALRWGLYSGDSVLSAATTAYFRRFQQLILNDVNGALVAGLTVLPVQPAEEAPYEPAYRALKTHLMISSGACKPDPQLVQDVLKQMVAPAGFPAAGTPLIHRQIDFYASELPYGNPCRVAENAAARDRARQYLAKIKGVDRMYASILARAEKTLSGSQRLSELAPNYKSVLSGPGEMPGAFTLAGWNFVEKASKEQNAEAAGEECVVGASTGPLLGLKQDAETERAIQRLYIRDYIARWRKFVTSFSVIPYGGPDDAARKLEILAGHKSPLLALFAMTANETTFASKVAEPDLVDKVKQYVPGLAKAQKAATTAEALTRKPELSGSPEDITRAFQPVHWVVPARSDTWVEKSNAYIDALAQLSHSMQEIARAGRDPAVHQAAAQNYEKALDSVRQIARGFRPIGVEGLDSSVQRVLEQPIVYARRFIITDMGKAEIAKMNGEARAFCTAFRPVTGKYPFHPSREDVNLQELAAWFAPSAGGIWKFQAQTLGEFLIKEGLQWKPKDPAKKPAVSPDMLAFLNRAQAITDSFYPAGATQPQFTYTLRPRLDSSYKDSILELEVDGRSHQWTTSLQKQFAWPGTADPNSLGAVVRIRTGAVSVAVASRAGLWGIFRVIGDAEPRPVGSKVVEWKTVRGGDGRPEPIQPGPVKLEIVEFPGGVDLFNPKFLDGLRCPGTAVE